jgi:hypothetical protein
MSSGRREGIPTSIGYTREARWAEKVRQDGHRIEREARIELERAPRKNRRSRKGGYFLLGSSPVENRPYPYYGKEKVIFRAPTLEGIKDFLRSYRQKDSIGPVFRLVWCPPGTRMRIWRRGSQQSDSVFTVTKLTPEGRREGFWSLADPRTLGLTLHIPRQG